VSIFILSPKERRALLLILGIISIGLAFKFVGKILSVPQIEPKFYPEKTCIDINQASFEELQTIPHIGPKIASRIMSYRNSKKIESCQELLNIKGIGEKKLEIIRKYLCF